MTRCSPCPRPHVPFLQKWWRQRQPHPGARVDRCRCFLPDLTGFTVYRREGTDAAAIDRARIALSSWRDWRMTQFNLPDSGAARLPAGGLILPSKPGRHQSRLARRTFAAATGQEASGQQQGARKIPTIRWSEHMRTTKEIVELRPVSSTPPPSRQPLPSPRSGTPSSLPCGS